MGCDIHSVVEIKRSNLADTSDCLWQGVMNLDFLARDYDRFACLFGVRHYPDEQDLPGVGVFANRGLPSDISDMTEREYGPWEADAHSETYAYQHEIESVLEGTKLGSSDGGYRDESWMQALNSTQLIHDLFENDEHYDDPCTRWVVWFDN